MKFFWKELNRRKVTRVGLAYLVLSWLVLQVADVILPALGVPDWSIILVLALLVLGFASYMARGYGQLACECYADAEKAFLKAVQLAATQCHLALLDGERSRS